MSFLAFVQRINPHWSNNALFSYLSSSIYWIQSFRKFFNELGSSWEIHKLCMQFQQSFLVFETSPGFNFTCTASLIGSISTSLVTSTNKYWQLIEPRTIKIVVKSRKSFIAWKWSSLTAPVFTKNHILGKIKWSKLVEPCNTDLKTIILMCTLH